MRSFPIRMPDPIHHALRGAAYYSGRSMNELALDAIRSYLTAEQGGVLDAMVSGAQVEYRESLDRLGEL